MIVHDHGKAAKRFAKGPAKSIKIFLYVLPSLSSFFHVDWQAYKDFSWVESLLSWFFLADETCIIVSFTDFWGKTRKTAWRWN